MKTALVTGITGQDGAYLARHLLEKGYRVVGGMRRASTQNLWRLEELGIRDDVELVVIDLLEVLGLSRMLQRIAPDEIYNLAAQSFVGTSFDQPIFTTQVNGLAVTYLLEVLRTEHAPTRFYQASTSEMFGRVRETPQSEDTPFYPRSPYAVSKLQAHWITVNYREAFDMFACSGILFNHESPLRGREFVTRKITSQLAEIAHGRREVLELGNLDAKRDWGFAGDYVKGMHLMLQAETPDDYVLATGQCRSVREFVAAAGEAAGMDLEFSGEGVDEVAIDRRSGRERVRVNPEFFRPAEVALLQGDSSKARRALGWQPETSLETLVQQMMEADLRRVRDRGSPDG